MKKTYRVLLLLSCFNALAAVPTTEKNALIALYDATAGSGWSNNTNWTTGDPCDNSWSGVTCNNDNTHVVTLDLSENNLVGTLPAELGDLTELLQLRLNSYQGNNQLSGTIPSALSNLTNLVSLELSGNQLSGQIPSEIGSLTGLLTLYLDGNKLSGEVPASIKDMTSVYPNFDFNALYSNDPTVNSFIDSQCFCSWSDTQTVAPDNFEITASTGTTVTLGWDAVTYTQAGGYRILQAENPVGPYTEVVELVDKATSSYQVTGLTPDNTYHFLIETFTAPHANNVNEVVSEAADMLVTGCQPIRSTYHVSNMATLNHAVNCTNEQQSVAFIEFKDDIIYDQAFYSDVTYGQTAVPPVISSIVIRGNGYTLSRDENLSCVDDQLIDSGEFRLLLVGPSGGLFIEDLTIANGCVYGGYGNTEYESFGGGLYAFGRYLKLINTKFYNNKAVYAGGAWLNSDSNALQFEKVLNNAFDSNVALETAGGLGVGPSAYGTGVGYNTFMNNQAKQGAGLYFFNHLGGINNNTFSGNQASELGGGVSLGAFTLLFHNTFVANSASTEGGAISVIWDSTGSVRNNLFVNNVGVNADCAIGDYFALSGESNLSNQSSSDCGFTIASNLTPSTVGPLMDNGCATYSELKDGSCVLTHALLDGSEAIDIDGSAQDWGDQRGYTTYQFDQGGVRDIGAFEYHPAGETPVEDVMFKGHMEGYD